jgi:hypothetical protein
MMKEAISLKRQGSTIKVLCDLYIDLKMQLHYQKSEEDAFRHAKRRQTFLKRMLSVKKFDSLISTEDYNAVDEPQFYGKYAHIRKMLDYTYHSHYRKERQWLQGTVHFAVLKLV